MKWNQAFVLFIAMLVTFSILSSQNAKNLKFEIELEKGTYIECESIYAHVILRNTGSSSVTANQLSTKFGFLNFIVKNNSGMFFEGGRAMLDQWPAKKISIKPRDSKHALYDLLPSYGTGSELANFQTQRFLPTGIYSLLGKYFSGSDTMFSNSVEFTVSKPAGLEALALELLKEGLDDYANRRRDQAILKLRSLAEKYSSSVYTPIALMQIVNIYEYSFNDRDKAKEAALSVIEKFPDTYHAVSAKSFIVTRTQDVNQRLQFLRSLASKYPNTKVGRDAQRVEAELRPNQ